MPLTFSRQNAVTALLLADISRKQSPSLEEHSVQYRPESRCHQQDPDRCAAGRLRQSFDEMCGYYGKQGHIAQFERDLDSRKLYEKFKSAYENIAGRPGTGPRAGPRSEKHCQSLCPDYRRGRDIGPWASLDKYRNQHRVSIEDFAEQVQAISNGNLPISVSTSLSMRSVNISPRM
jgi:hypothetical protein